MEAIAEGLWVLADKCEQSGHVLQALKCLEAICQSSVSFLPIIEVKTRLRIATLLLQHTHNLMHAKFHLERAELLLKQIPSCFELKCRAYSLLSKCYHLIGSVAPRKQTLKKGLELAIAAGDGESYSMWACNFNLQLANALNIEGDYAGVYRALESGLQHAAKTRRPEVQLVFAVSMLHVNLAQCDNAAILEGIVRQCDDLWNQVAQENKQSHLGLHVYNELLHVLYFLRCCDYKAANEHVKILDAALASKRQVAAVPNSQNELENKQLDLEIREVQQNIQLFEQQLQNSLGIESQELHNMHQKFKDHLSLLQNRKMIKNSSMEEAVRKSVEEDKLHLGPPPFDGEWLPTSAVLVLVDLVAVSCVRPKGMFAQCIDRIQAGLNIAEGQLLKLGITRTTKEMDLPHWAILIAAVYLILILQLLENKIIIDLTRTEFPEAQKSLVELLEMCSRFPTLLQSCEGSVHMLLGHYAHSLGCFKEATMHFTHAVKLTDSKGFQAICQVYAAVSLICIGDADSLSQALDLIGPVYRLMDTFVGSREKTLVMFASGLLQLKQQHPQEARMRLASGLKLTHKGIGNHQLISQYLTVLGSIALAIHDNGQASDILKSSLTLAKSLHDIPATISAVHELTALHYELGETSKALDTSKFEKEKLRYLQNSVEATVTSQHHPYLLKYGIEQRW